MRRLLTVFSITTLALVVSTALSAQSSQNDPHIGTWKLNVEKSSVNTHKSETRTYTQSGDSLTAHVEMVNSDGSTTGYEYTAKLDGKDYPLRVRCRAGLRLFPSNALGTPLPLKARRAVSYFSRQGQRSPTKAKL